MILRVCIVTLFLVIGLAKRNAAILLSSSIGYYNYRQGGNLLVVYKFLKEQGFKDKDIILMMPENPGCCQKNPIPGSISFIDNDYTNINTDIELENRYSNINVRELYDTLRGKSNPDELNKRKLSLTPDTNVFLYVTGHGGDSYFKLREREAIINAQFSRAISELYNKTMYQNYFSMSDSCGASTLFSKVTSPNFISIGSSSEGQKSMSHGNDPIYNSAKSDDFTFYLNDYFNTNSVSNKDLTIGKLYKYMDYDKLKVHSELKSTYPRGKGEKLPLSQFMVKEQDILQVKELKDLKFSQQFSNFIKTK